MVKNKDFKKQKYTGLHMKQFHKDIKLKSNQFNEAKIKFRKTPFPDYVAYK